jgi:drug/metabolite transporter (DMT)-like permease
MSVLLGLLAAATYGSSDFLAGLVSRRLPAVAVAAGAQAICLAVGLIAVAFYPGGGMSGRILLWGLAGGLGSAGGTFALYRGLGAGEMSVVATLSGLLTAVIPVTVGLATGDSLSAVAAIGIVAAIPAIGLVSWQSGGTAGAAGSGVAWGLLAGLGLGLLYVAYDRAGAGAGAWPLVIAEGSATVLSVGPALLALRQFSVAGAAGAQDIGALTDARILALLLAAGLLAGTANLAFVIATHNGELAIVAVLNALYPGFTVVLARLFLGERWSGPQKLGLATALAAILLVSLGST